MQGVEMEGVKGGIYAPKPPGMFKSSTKNRSFPTLTEFKTDENAYFTQNCLKIYT
jgi:hypothetical protein